MFQKSFYWMMEIFYLNVVLINTYIHTIYKTVKYLPKPLQMIHFMLSVEEKICYSTTHVIRAIG